MNGFKRLFLIGFLVVAPIIVTGCTIRLGGGGTTKAADAGVWRSDNFTANWAPKSSIANAAGPRANLSGFGVRKLVLDPEDLNTIYSVTDGHGVFYSYDRGESWQTIKQFASSNVKSIAVDPKSKCVLYLVVDNRLFKSTDCGRFWDNTYFHQNPQVSLTDVIINEATSSNIFIANSVGEIIKSQDGGITWATVMRATGPIAEFILDPLNHETIYAATPSKGIYKSIDNGENWNSLGEGLKSYAGSNEYKSLIVYRSDPNILFLIFKFGILKSVDGGQSWNIVDLLVKSATITAAAINPKNSDEIYYTTSNTLVRTTDGAKTWKSTKLPFSSRVNEILVDYERPNIIYFGNILPPK